MLLFTGNQTASEDRRTGSIEDFIALRNNVYETLAKRIESAPDGTNIEQATSALPMRMFPDNDLIRREAAHQKVEHINSVARTLELDDAL